MPPTIGFQAADAAGALQATIGVLAALLQRTSTGRGQMVDVSMTESAMVLAMPSIVNALAGHAPSRGSDMLNGGLTNYRNYKTKDGKFLAVGALEPHFWQKACDAIGLSATASAEQIEMMFLSRSADEWRETLKAVDVCIEVMLEPQELTSHPQHAARKVVLPPSSSSSSDSNASQLVVGPRLGDHPEPVRLSAAPKIGEHTRLVLTEAGFSSEEIEALAKAKIVECNDEPVHVQLKPMRMEVEAGKEYWWCSCGRSHNQPYCDGSHKGTGFSPVKVVAEASGLYPFCGCRVSKLGARCDGTHKKLKPTNQ